MKKKQTNIYNGTNTYFLYDKRYDIALYAEALHKKSTCISFCVLLVFFCKLLIALCDMISPFFKK